MKNNLHANPLLFKMMILITCFMLVILYNKSRAASITPVMYEKVAVNFKHNKEKNELGVIVKSTTAETFQLFIFSMDGELVKEAAVSKLKTTTIKNLKRGYYMYECFDNDKRMERGNLLIK